MTFGNSACRVVIRKPHFGHCLRGLGIGGQYRLKKLTQVLTYSFGCILSLCKRGLKCLNFTVFEPYRDSHNH